MQVYVNYPQSEEDIKTFLNNLAIFKAELMIKSIENMNANDKIKEEVLERVLEILDKMPEDSVI